MANKQFFRFILLCGMFSISMVAIAQPQRGPFVISPQVQPDEKGNHKNRTYMDECKELCKSNSTITV